MTRRLVELYRRLDELQRRRGVRIALSILALLLSAAVFLPLYRETSAYAAKRDLLMSVLEGQSLAHEDSVAVQLRDFGTVTAGGRDYGGPEILALGDLLFDASGQINAPHRLVALLLADERPRWVPEFLLEQAGTTWIVGIVGAAWLQLIVWLGVTLPFLLVLAGTAIVAAPFWLAGAAGGAVAVGGIGLLTFSFVLLVRLLLLLLQLPFQPFAVAHTVVKEAVRLNVSLPFIVVLLVVLPLIPLWIDPEQPLRYQVQTFISRSMSLTYVAAACMTLLLACATVAFEIRDRQIWQLMTKPLGRFNYLLGKFIGVAALNVVLLLICGISIFVFVQYLRTRPAADMLDAAAVRDEVLVARRGAFPEYDGLSRDELIAWVDRELADDPIMLAEIESGQRTESDVRRSIALRLQTEHLQRQRQVPSGEKRTYVFRGLDRARAMGAPLTMRYKFYAGRSDPHEALPVMFEFDGIDTVLYRKFVPVQGHVITIPAAAVRDDGTVQVSIYNSGHDQASGQFFPGPYTITFDAEDFEILYKVADFEWNFFRAVLVLWIKLCFLAMLGVCAATFLSFPVACILSFTVFLLGSMAPFIAESLEYWSVDSPFRVDQRFVMWIATGSEWLLRSFGALRPTSMLVEGRLIPVSQVAGALAVIGLFWCGAAMLVGWLAFRRRELAIYSGHG